ncbi:hypothetical protein [Actinotalea sp. Marseille-Q4924]|uniref:hypothetical protein n=1 Tax=Actinotalea sp. Marseille-Q4924 TaxID=2866571 RepID=UPI001CE3B872|nr:hypothetical protein [Actinotalea sp. Marseille-Q4924]
MENSDEPGSFFRVYLLTLPDPIPLHPGSTWTRVLPALAVPELAGMEWAPTPHLASRPSEGSNFVSLKFWQVPTEMASGLLAATRVIGQILGTADRELAQAPSHPEGAYVTVVEAVTCVRPLSLEADGDDLTRCIDELLAYHRAYRLAEDVRVPELTYERLHPLVPRLERDIADPGPPQPMGITVLNHANIPGVVPEPLTQDGHHRIDQFIRRSAVHDPFVLFAERRLDAVVEANVGGRPGESVVQTAIAAEILLDAVLGVIMWEKRTAVDEAATVFSKPLTSRVQTDYHPRLGGQWSVTGQKLSPWHSHVAGVRNRVVHAGYRPSGAEARTAMDALRALELFIGDRLAERFKSHPKCAWLFLGAAGLEGRGRLGAGLRWAEDVGEPLEDAMVGWLKAYRLWREQVDDHVQRQERERRG